MVPAPLVVRAAAALTSAVLVASLAACGDGTADGAGAGGGSAPTAPLAAIVEEEAARVDAPGLLAAVRFADGSEWVDVVGVADLDTGEPLSADATWPLRSVSKSFAVAVLLQLADEGRLSLDDVVSDHLAGVPGGDGITLAQLADMSSGLPEYANAAFVEDFLADVTRVYTDAELLAFVDGEPPQFDPGERAVYTNTNTLVIGMVVEAVTGTSMGEVLGERILGPLELSGTSYRPDVAAVEREVPVGYQPGDDGMLPAPLTFGVFGASGAMATTVDDLLSWGPVLATGALLDDGGRGQRAAARPLEEGPEYDAYGQGIGELDGWWGHTGEGLGYTTLVMHDRETGTTVVVLATVSNLDGHLPTAVFRRMTPLLEDAGR